MARRRPPTSEDRPNLTVVGSSDPVEPEQPDAESSAPTEPNEPKSLSVSEAVDDGDLLTILLAQQRSLAEIAEHGKAPDRIRAHQQLTGLSEQIAVMRRAAGDGPDSIVDDAPDQPWDGTWNGPGY
ncbi:hypothetical protein FZI85_25090 [Mycobacterium sp. CBMA293]|uniref:hypothetical protein n=1 Tax=unclassified Mycolicibacterium TaxID=2636767 RepID=UPI0012DE36BC|nr:MULTISPECIES: hypothetical protein [unclassified Mycolicibacterium]MUL47593.1 hypothetical protein [Mycolicibacterium sp. CBMA 360]MUL61889.1 hypothetical protein [Mycolicibacterium sp. CBMA 335]MUL68962.1 hypothetical protein [Mycolicibacterium sp. CBMA 311]MUL92821.1 hypothetical protein [Mycolicibacterium sp. CBMA 230]MUM14285.1 hypothetical protein [Mycolicibacterium sp. CBMA 293]